MKRHLLLFILFTLIKTPSNAQCNGRYLLDIFDSVTVIRDIEFGRSVTSDGDTLILKMDVYLPYGDIESSRPLLLWAHGGSFMGGDKNENEATLPCIAMTKKGYVTASINYRLESNPLALLSAETMIKAVVRSVQDYKAAIRFFRKDVSLNGNTFGIDTALIILGGDSAGGIAALHTVYLNDSSELELQFRKYLSELGGPEGNSGNPGYSSSASAVVQVSGALRDVKYMNDNKNIPVFSCHHEIDFTIPYGTYYPYFIPSLPMVSGSQVISDQARRLGIYHDLYTIPGVGHLPYVSDSGAVQPVFDSMITKMSRFLFRILDCNPDHIILGLQKESQKNVLSVYPNPSNDRINILLNNNNSASVIKKIEVMNSLGEQVLVRDFVPNSANEIRLEGLQKGLFILNAFDANSILLATQKIIIQ